MTTDTTEPQGIDLRKATQALKVNVSDYRASSTVSGAFKNQWRAIYLAGAVTPSDSLSAVVEMAESFKEFIEFRPDDVCTDVLLQTTTPDEKSIAVATGKGLVTKAYKFCEQGDARAAIKHVNDYLDDLLLREQYDVCNTVLEYIAPERLRVEVLIAILTLTFTGAQKLPSRQALWDWTECRVRLQYGPSRADSLLARLK